MLFINHVFLCLIRSPIYLYCSPVILCCHINVIFNIAIKVRGLACHKTRFNPPFFPLKMSCTKSGIWPLLYYSSFLCVLHFNVLFPLSRLCFLLFLSYWDKTCHGTCLSQIHVFGFDVIYICYICYSRGILSDAWSVSVCVTL